ncbi:putative phage abortive infection protein [Vibrio parahaemolyticus]|uniref:putative phage abortive infection protein n=2 Tax=Vibrio parahaemolyticus TaxID=670 RepID=UPI002361C240|nr:putative phage abortive infection protein [Vibrio parahaemolyticus]
MNYKNLKYKSYEGTVVLRSDWKFEGEVIGLTKNRKYFGKDFNELEAQFKNKVDYFYEQCAMLGVEPEPLGKRQSPKLPYLVLFFSAIFSMSLLWWIYTNEFPFPNVASEVKVKADWYDKSSSFFNNFSAPILSFFSFIGLLFTIYQQNRSHRLSLKELSLTREELELTRKEFAKTTIANEKQANALDQQVKEAKSAAEEQKTLASEQRLATQIQQFESSFYALLSEHNKALGDMDAGSFRVSHLSKTSFVRILEIIQSNVQLCRYFRMLYQLLKFIATNHVDNTTRDFSNEYLRTQVLDQEKRYASLVRSMLPQNILGYLAVNSCNGFEPTHPYHKYFLLLQRYAFLEHLNVDVPLTFDASDGFLNVDKSMLPSAMVRVLQSYTDEAFGLNESIEGLESRLMLMIDDEYEEYVVLGKGEPGSVYDDITKKCMPTNSLL